MFCLCEEEFLVSPSPVDANSRFGLLFGLLFLQEVTRKRDTILNDTASKSLRYNALLNNAKS